MPIERVAGRLERLDRGAQLPVAEIRLPAKLQQPSDLGGVGGGVDEPQRLPHVIEDRLRVTSRKIGHGDEAQKHRALAWRDRRGEGGGGFPSDDRPVTPFRRGFRGKAVKAQTLRGRERLVADEVIEGAAEPGRDDLERTYRRTDESGLDLTNEALGKLLARELGLAHAELPASGAHALAERNRGLDGLSAARHARSPMCRTPN